MHWQYGPNSVELRGTIATIHTVIEDPLCDGPTFPRRGAEYPPGARHE